MKKPKAKLKSVVRPQILASIAIKNLLAKRTRTILTTGGIVIGIGAVVFLVSLASGLRNTVNQHVIGSQSVETIDVTSPNATAIPLDDSRVNKMQAFAHVTKVSPAFIMPGKLSYKGSLTDTVLYGVNNDYIALSSLKFVAGTNSLKASNDAIISTSLLSLIGQPNAKTAIGQTVSIETTVTLPNGATKDFKTNLKIAGVANIGAGVAVYMDRQVLHKAGASDYGQVKVVADNRVNVPTIRTQIAGLGLTTASPLDTLNEINTIFTIFTFVVIGFGGIGMIIAILGTFNTLTVSLLERTKEIGLMITMGARKADVRRLLTFEALLLSLFGGIGGIIAAWLGGFFIDLWLNYFAHSHGVAGNVQAFSVSPLLIVVTLAFALFVGWLVALYPARRASKINPIDALRHE